MQNFRDLQWRRLSDLDRNSFETTWEFQSAFLTQVFYLGLSENEGRDSLVFKLFERSLKEEEIKLLQSLEKIMPLTLGLIMHHIEFNFDPHSNRYNHQHLNSINRSSVLLNDAFILPTCYRCGGKGHIRRNCNTQSIPNNWQPRGSRGGKRKSIGILQQPPKQNISEDKMHQEQVVITDQKSNDTLKSQQSSIQLVSLEYPVRNSNTIRFRFPIYVGNKSLNSTAYTLYDCGASSSFVSDRFIENCKQAQMEPPTRFAGTHEIVTAGKSEIHDLRAVFLSMQMGSFHHSRWFLVYPLKGYDLILGKDFMEDIPQKVDFVTNRLSLPNSTIQGLSQNDRNPKGPRTECLLLPTDHRLVPSENQDSERNDIEAREFMEVDESVNPAAELEENWELFVAEATEHPALKDEPPDTHAGSFTALDKAIREEYRDVFEEPTGLPPRRPHLATGDFRIRLIPGSKAPYRPPYRMTPAEKEEYSRQITAFRAKGHIRESQSPYAAPLMFVPKPGTNDFRMVIDYRKLNDITIKDRYPLPIPEELLDKLQGKKFFSKMDFNSGYCQGRVASEDIEKTAFVGPDGLWEWLVVPQGITTAPAWFMRMVSEVLKEHTQKDYLVVFMDDIQIYSDNMEEHVNHVRAVMDTLRKYNFKLKDRKCFFGRKETEFVGYKVDGEGIRLLDRKINSIIQWPMVSSPKDTRIFLGLVGAYRKFIPNLGVLAAPLNTLTTLSKPEFDTYMDCLERSQNISDCMEKIKSIITSDPCLSLPHKNVSTFIVRTDASDFGIGATLRQEQPVNSLDNHTEERILAYYSRKLHGAECRYSTYDKELLAIRDALIHWRYYLLGRKTKITTDHVSIKHMLTQPRLTQRQMRTLADILEYDFEIDYLPGARNYIQDALSRRPDYKQPPLPKTTPSQVATSMMQLELDEQDNWFRKIREGYLKDPYYKDVLDLLENKLNSTISVQEKRRCQARAKFFSLEQDGLLTHTPTGNLCIPDNKEIKLAILQEAHDSATGGHFGEKRTLSAISRRFFWRRLWQDVKRYCRGCATCARTKPTNHKPYGLLQPLDIPDERWRRINIDFITKLPVTSQGHDTIVTFIDGLTKRAHWIAASEKFLTAEKFANLFIDFYIRLHGLPDIIVSDRDVRFTSDFWRHLTSQWETKLSFSTAFHPQTDGQAEKANSIVERYLRAFATHKQNSWDTLLPMAEFAYNSHTHQATGKSPFEADLGYIPRMPLDTLATTRLRRSPRGHIDANFTTHMADILKELKTSLAISQEQQIMQANSHRQSHNFQEGDHIFLATKDLPLTYANSTVIGQPHRKALQHKFIGEFQLGSRRGENAFEVHLPEHWKLARTFNVSKMKHSLVDHSRDQAPPPPLRIETIKGQKQPAWEIEEIRGRRRNRERDGRIEFEVKWKGFKDCTWEPLESFEGGGMEAIRNYLNKNEDAFLE